MANSELSRPNADGVAIENFKGLRNTVEASKFDLGDLAAALNVDIDDELAIKMRRGQHPVLTGDTHSIWSDGDRCFAVIDDVLVEVLPDFATRTVRAGMTPKLPVAYAAVPGRYFWTNGKDRGAVDAGGPRSWGLRVPPRPVVSETGGALRGGTYQVSLRASRSNGTLGGACGSVALTIADDRGLAIEVPELVEGAAWYELYVSNVGGTPYYVGNVDGATTVYYRAQAALGRPLEAQFFQPPPLGTALLAMGGYMLVARGEVLYTSEPFHPELFDIRRGYHFGADLTGLALVDDGVYVGAGEKVMFLPGRDPSAWKAVEAYGFALIPGSVAYGPGEDLGDGVPGIIPFAMTAAGPVALLPGGRVRLLTGERFEYPRQERAAGVVRTTRGTSQFVCTLQGTERS